MLNNFFSINCDTAVNGQEAVTKAKNKKYDAILMDMRMPIMDGLDATRAIREFDKDIQTINSVLGEWFLIVPFLPHP